MASIENVNGHVDDQPETTPGLLLHETLEDAPDADAEGEDLNGEIDAVVVAAFDQVSYAQDGATEHAVDEDSRSVATLEDFDVESLIAARPVRVRFEFCRLALMHSVVCSAPRRQLRPTR